MNTAINGTVAMGQDSTMAHSNNYSNDGWASISPYSHSPYGNSPMNEYGHFNGYMPHGLPTESMSRTPSESMSRMPPPHQQQSHTPTQHHQLIQPAAQHMGHQQLPMLNTTWPSQLTNPTPSSGTYSAPPVSMAPGSAPVIDAPRLPMPHEKARKTLSAEQKRAMCLYHEENPGTRQADIGARFGVERSTVSKVLRHKDQYLKREQEVDHGSSKRAKGKNPDFDRTLSNYVRRQQHSGFDVNDEEILEQAKLFAHASGNQEALLPSLTGSWLQKFKQKHGIGAGRLMRRASEANIPDSARMSTSLRDSKKERILRRLSPVSPGHQPSPLSGSRSEEDLQSGGGFNFEFSYRQNASQSTTSLASDMRDNGASSFAPVSPTTSFNFSPDANTGAFAIDPNMQIRSGPPPDFNGREKRSHTFPSLGIEYANQTIGSQPMTPRLPSSTTAPSSAIESPAHEMHTAPFNIDTSLTSPPTLHRTSSNSSINGRSNTTPSTTNVLSATSVESSPVSPTPEDARRAANTLLNYIQSMSTNGQFDQNEYMAVVQLTKKLQIYQHQTIRPAIGGLSRIPESDTEMPAPHIVSAMEAR